MRSAAIGKTVVVANGVRDYPAIVTNITTNHIVNLVTFEEGKPPAYPRYVVIHPDRPTAMNAHLKDGGTHAYWPA